MKIFAVFSLLLLCAVSAFSQKKKAAIKPDEISLKDFEKNVYTIDSSAQAVVLYDGGSAIYKSDNSSWFNVIYTYHRRIRLLNKNAFSEATIEIPLYKLDPKEERLDNLEAATYNVENGVLRKTKLDKESLFTDKASKDISVKKFTLPDLKEGCIIDYSYSIISPITQSLKSWSFQDKYPVLLSNYEVTAPTLFNFVFLNNGYYNLDPVSVDEGFQSYNIVYRENSTYGKTEMYTYNATTHHTLWTLRDLPAMVKENYTTSLRNHISRIEFQLRSLDYPEAPPKSIMGSWEELGTELMKDADFGKTLAERNGWMDKEVIKLSEAGKAEATARNIYNYVRDNYTCTDDEALYMKGPLKQIFQSGKGNVAELNLLLTAMMIKANIKADPVLLSTRDHGFAYELYPLINKFNYVICKVNIAGKDYLLDASKKRLGFNRLSEESYNGYGRVVTNEPYLVSLSPDSLHETKLTTIFVNNDPASGKLFCSFTSDLGYFESYDLRETMAGSSREEYFKKLKNSFNTETTLKETAIDSLNNPDDRVTVRYNFTFDLGEELVYFNPLMSEGYKSNPFKAAVRNYPVEMPYASDELIVFNMEVPAGYKIDELPKSVRISLGDNAGMFEYLVQADAEMIQLKCRLKLNKATFEPDEYSGLRDFYGHVVKKQAEQIVFRKK